MSNKIKDCSIKFHFYFSELRKWLNRPDLSFVENLNFAIKVWNSIEFVLLTKQEIIVDEFCNNLPKLRKEIKNADNPSEHCDLTWTKINEFLSFRYSAGAVSVAIKEKLIKTLTKEAEHSVKHDKLSILILNALTITLHNTSMQNYYKSNVNEFAKFLGKNIGYLTELLKQNAESITEGQQKQYKEHIDQILTALRTFIKQTPLLDEFKSSFATEIIQVLCELVISAKNLNITTSVDFLTILQELYFDGSQTNLLKQYFDSSTSEQIQNQKYAEYMQIFEVPMHVFLTVIEAVILSYRNDVEMQQSFFQYLFGDGCGKFCVADNGATTKLNSITHFLWLLKKYEMPINFEIDSVKAFVYLGKHIEQLVNLYHTTFVYEVLNLLCAALKLDPLILEHSVCSIAVKFMIIAKVGENVWSKYEEFMSLTIEMYRKLSRAEKFISQLIKNLYETLSKIKLSKKLKRTFDSSFVEGATPSKKLKKSNEEGVEVEIVSTESTEDHYIKLLEKNILSECDGFNTKIQRISKNRSTTLWNDISFALSPAISIAYTRFISGLISKPSLVVWKTLIFTIKDYVQELKDNEGKHTENSIFLIEVTSALLSQYFMGTRLAEQSDKIWDSIETNCKLTRNVLTEFGHAILTQEHNSRTMNAFLKLCYSASNFDLVCWYYCPDSMQMEGNDDTTKFDGLKRAQKLHSYLTEKEWTTIEQRITNFGKRECKANMNRIYLQRLKANQLFNPNKVHEDIGKHMLSITFSDAEQILDILSDQSLCTWFIDNLNAKQKQTVCEMLLQLTNEKEVLDRLQHINNREFMEILIYSAYKRLTEILGKSKVSSYLAGVDFEIVFGTSSESVDVCQQLNAIIDKLFVKEQWKISKKQSETIQNSQEDISSLLHLLEGLPIGFCAKNLKNLLVLLNIYICRVLLGGPDDVLNRAAFNIFKGNKLHHFYFVLNKFSKRFMFFRPSSLRRIAQYFQFYECKRFHRVTPRHSKRTRIVCCDIQSPLSRFKRGQLKSV